MIDMTRFVMFQSYGLLAYMYTFNSEKCIKCKDIEVTFYSLSLKCLDLASNPPLITHS